MNDQESVAFAKKYLEDIISFFGINIDVEVRSSEEVIELAVPVVDSSGFLIGRGGETLRSLQLIVSAALRSSGASIDRVSIDVADYKKQRADRLAIDVRGWAEEVLASGQPKELAPMNAADRRIVHHTVGELSGLQTYSEGEGRDRHIVIAPLS